MRGSVKLSFLRSLWDPSAASRRDTEDPIRSELFSIERLEQHAESLAAAQARHGQADTRAAARDAPPRQRSGAARRVSRHRRCDPRGARHHAGGRVAGRQLPRRRGPDSRDPRRSPARLLPPAAQALGRSPRGLSARLRARVGLRRPYRQPLRPADALPLRARLPARAAAHDRRALGRRDHAAHRARREPAARRPSGSSAAGPRAARPTPWPTGCWTAATGSTRSTDTEALRLEQGSLSREFAVQLVQRLRDQDPTVTPAVQWLDERLAAQGTTADEIVREEHQRQGAMNVTVRNVITSMRLMSAVDWAELFESVSLVDAALRADSDFAAMDFATRDRYRHAIEELARGSGHSELEVARRAILATKRPLDASRGEGEPPARREQDPGYFLISRGRRRFERELGFRVPVRYWPARAAARTGLPGYLGALTLVTALILAAPLVALSRAGVGDATLLVLALLALVPASDAALALVNRIVTTRFGPRALPGLELRERGAGQPAHDGRRAHPADDPRRNRGADRASGGPRSREPRRRPALRPALGLDGRRHGVRAGRRRAPCRGRRGDRAHESTPRPRAGRRPVPAAASPARLERRGREVDGLGAQARKAPRAEPVAARRDRHDVPGRRRPSARRTDRRPLRDHARRRYPASARRGEAPGRKDGASAQPSDARRAHAAAWSRDTRCSSRASRRRCRSVARGRSSSASSRVPAAWTPTRSPSPTSTRTSSGRAPTAGRASTTWTSSKPRSKVGSQTTRC